MVPTKVREVLEAHGLRALEFEAGSTPTSVAAAERLGVEVGQIAKSILLKGKDGKFYLVVMPGDRRLKNWRLKAAVGVKTRMATPEETEAITGFRPGGVCPFGVENVEIYLDEALSQFLTIYPAAGTDASGVPMTFSQLRTITNGREAPLSSEDDT